MTKSSPIRVRIPVLLCLAAFLGVFALINFRYMPYFIDGDIFEDMQLAREMWRQKTLFPSNWIYGNQYYTIATPVAAALFYGLTGSLNLSMALATTLMGALILWSFWWMLRPFVRSETAILAAMLLLVAAPMGRGLLLEPEGQLFFTLASYYACYLIALFVIFGDYARACLQPERGLRPGALVFSLALCLLTGMQSLRQTLVAVLPVLALELWRLLCRRSQRQSLVRAGSYLLLNLAGLGLMRLLRVPSKSIYGSVSLGGGLKEKLLDAWHSLRGITGLDAACFSSPRVFFTLFFLFCLLLVLIAAAPVLRKCKAPDGAGLLWLLCLVSLLGVLAAGVLVEIRLREIYLFVWYPLVALSLLPVLELTKEKGRAWLLLGLCVLSLGNLGFSYGSSLRGTKSLDPAPYYDLARDAKAAGRDLVYGQWKTVPHALVWSDGALTGGFWGDILFEIQDTINLTDVYTPEDNDRALYLIGPWQADRENFMRYARELGAAVTLFGEYGDYIAYTSDIQLMHFGG